MLPIKSFRLWFLLEISTKIPSQISELSSRGKMVNVKSSYM